MKKFQCSKCKEWKQIKDFHKDKTHKDGKASQCKKCINERHREKRYWKNKNDYQKSWRLRNKDKVKQINKRTVQRINQNPKLHLNRNFSSNEICTKRK